VSEPMHACNLLRLVSCSATHSFGSLLGCGTRRISPVLSYLRFGSLSAGFVTLVAVSSRMLTVPVGDEMRMSEILLRSSGWTVLSGTELTHLELALTSALPVFLAPCCLCCDKETEASDRLPRQNGREQQQPRYTKENGVRDILQRG